MCHFDQILNALVDDVLLVVFVVDELEVPVDVLVLDELEVLVDVLVLDELKVLVDLLVVVVIVVVPTIKTNRSNWK